MDLFGNDTPEPEDVIEEIDAGGLAPVLADIPVFAHPRQMSRISGHREVEKALLEMYDSGRMPHGLIFSGIEGIGKATMAFRFARFLLKRGLPPDPNQGGLFGEADLPPPAQSLEIDPQDRVFSWIASSAHPDLFSIERGFDEDKNRRRNNVDVDEVRKVAPFLRMTASEGGWRIVIVDDADSMNRNAQNALLKILEEPPTNTVLILVAHRLGRMIPTIRSRTRVVNFKPLPQDVITQELSRLEDAPSGQAGELLSHLSQGSLGRALRYAEGGGLELVDKTLAGFARYPKIDWTYIHKLSEEAGGYGNDAQFELFNETLIWVYENLTRSKARGQAAPVPALQQEAFGALLRNSSLEHLVKTLENLQSHFEKVKAANLDKRQAVLGAFSLIAA